jgi:hypothetical protein
MRQADPSLEARVHRKVLLVALPPFTESILERSLTRVAEVVSVPFPSSAFDRAAEEFRPDLVVVDLTYLDESVVRPLITDRFLDVRSLVVYVTDQGRAGWYDDLDSLLSGDLASLSVEGLVQLASGLRTDLCGDLPGRRRTSLRGDARGEAYTRLGGDA